jgi:hypothetical protein
MILHLGFDVCVKVDKVMQHIAQLCKSRAKKASRSVCSIRSLTAMSKTV